MKTSSLSSVTIIKKLRREVSAQGAKVFSEFLRFERPLNTLGTSNYFEDFLGFGT